MKSLLRIRSTAHHGAHWSAMRSEAWDTGLGLVFLALLLVAVGLEIWS